MDKRNEENFLKFSVFFVYLYIETTRYGNNKLVLLDVNENKDNVEIVHWHYIDEKGLNKIKRQAIREGDQILILPSEKTEEVGGLSDLTNGLSLGSKDIKNNSTKQEKSKKMLTLQTNSASK